MDESDFAAEVAIECQAIDAIEVCPSEQAALLGCFADRFDGFAGAVCGEDLADVACQLERTTFEECVDKAPKTPACIGRSASCYDLGSNQCVAQLGCELLGSCGGSSRSCERTEDETTCISQIGCDWDRGGESGRCEGTRRGCSDITSVTGCFDQLGCYVLRSSFSERCDGSATSCRDFRSSGGCDQQAGCAWVL